MACDCARVCGSHGKRYELLRPPTFASAALLADDPAERASAAGWKGGCLAQRFAATTYESRTTPWVQRALALSAARSMVAARPPTAKLQRVACSASSLRLLMCRRRLFRAYCVVLRCSLSLGDKGDNGRHQTNSSRLVGFGFVLVCPLAWTSTRLTQTDLVAAGAHCCGHVCGFVPSLSLLFFIRTQRTSPT